PPRPHSRPVEKGEGREMAAPCLPLRGLSRVGFVLGRGGVTPFPALPTWRRSYGTRTSPTGEKVTHTGQVYEEGDYRRVRFVGRQKEVNESFAIDLIAEEPVTEVETRVISCDGGGGALGHPKVYINLDKDTKTGTCGYCGLRFKQKHHH
ncbi:hypothetical protein JRQ81_011644, partial [Phrynocephalus forsythii]